MVRCFRKHEKEVSNSKTESSCARSAPVLKIDSRLSGLFDSHNNGESAAHPPSCFGIFGSTAGQKVEEVKTPPALSTREVSAEMRRRFRIAHRVKESKGESSGGGLWV
jgi:hypothetical protein